MSRYLAAAYFAMIAFHIAVPVFRYWNFILVDFFYMFIVFTWFLKLKYKKNKLCLFLLPFKNGTFYVPFFIPKKTSIIKLMILIMVSLKKNQTVIIK